MSALYFMRDESGKVTDVYNGTYTRGYECVRDLISFDEVVEIAQQITEASGKQMIATRNGPHLNIIAAPTVGAEVSYAFNGDCTPCGVITKVSKSLRRVETSTGKVFYRLKETAIWMSDKTWSMVYGHRHERNPEF